MSIGSNLPLILCTVYVPPNPSDDYNISLLNYLTELCSSSANVIIAGDFNLPDINWFSLTGMSFFSKLFCEFVFDNNLFQHVDSPTHVKGNILDIVLSNTSNVSNLFVDSLNHLLNTDHYIIGFNIELSLQLQKTRQVVYVFDYRNAEMDNLLSYLFDCDFSDCYRSNNIEYIWSTIKFHIYEAMTRYIPKVKVRRFSYPCWFTSDIKHHLNCVRTLRRKVKAHPTVYNISKLKSSEMCLKEKSRSAKTKYEIKLIQECAILTAQESINTLTELMVMLLSHKLSALSPVLLLLPMRKHLSSTHTSILFLLKVLFLFPQSISYFHQR